MNPNGLAIYSVSAHLKPKDLLPFASALTQQATDVADAYRLQYPHVVVVEQKDAIPDGWGWIVVADNIADAPDALAYHTKDIYGTVSGVCDAEKILALGGTLARGSLSVIAAIGHEIAEATVDAPCNRYAQAPTGDVWCLEVSDPVQGFVYKSRDGKADLSSFVMPNFFDLVMAEAFANDEIDSSTLGPLDKTEQIEIPFSLGAGGYAVVLRRGRVHQIGAETPAHKKGLPSRRAKRLAQLEGHEEGTLPSAILGGPKKAFSFSGATALDVLEVIEAAAGAFAALDPADAAAIRAKIDSLFTQAAAAPTGGGI